MRLTIVIPVYRENSRLMESLQKVTEFVRTARGVAVEVVFVDDGSPDNCAQVIRSYIERYGLSQMRLLNYAKNQGKGYAVGVGVQAAGGDLILMSDADLSTPLTEWAALKAAIDSGADIACGSRAVRGAHIGTPPPLCRRFLSRIFNRLVRIAGVHGIRDTQCGFKLFRAAPAKEIFARLRTRRFAFDVEVIALARDLGYRVDEVPVSWNYSGHTTVRLFSSGGQMLWDVFKLAIRRMICGSFKCEQVKRGENK